MASSPQRPGDTTPHAAASDPQADATAVPVAAVPEAAAPAEPKPTTPRNGAGGAALKGWQERAIAAATSPAHRTLARVAPTGGVAMRALLLAGLAAGVGACLALRMGAAGGRRRLGLADGYRAAWSFGARLVRPALR